MFDSLARIPEWYDVDEATFHNDIAPLCKPAILKGLVSDWPSVKASIQSPAILCDYLLGDYKGGRVKVLEAPASTNGQFFYNDDLKGFNFERKEAEFSDFLNALLAPTGVVRSLQSAYVSDFFELFDIENSMNILGADVKPRFWMGNKTVVSTHYDDAENIACVVSGKRRFTLFPPEQISNLYIGPLDNTPAGAPVSMASLIEPDFQKFPKLKQALKTAVVAELEPGDAIYIPTLWWHHVEALSDFSMLVNYWSGGAIAGGKGTYPLDALLHSLITIKDLPPTQRVAWKALFDHYVFQEGGDPVAHLPVNRKGILGVLSPSIRMQVKKWLIGQLKG